MGTEYLLDSNTAIYLIKGSLPIIASSAMVEASADVPRLSVISKIEILGWNAPTEAEAKKCLDFVSDSRIYPLSDEIVEKTIWIRQLQQKPKLPDCIIAATALIHDMVLLTRNESDFSKIPGLRFVNPFVET